MSRPAVVLVEWRDALTATSGWTSIDDVRRYAADAWDSPISAAGFLVEDREHYVVLAVGYNPHPDIDEVNGGVMIPRSEVVRMVELAPAEGSS